MQYVFSTLANDQNYVDWKTGGGDLQIEGESVFIKGGTGVANDRLITPIGVCTEVTDEQVAILKKNSVFLLHKENGYVTISKKPAAPEKVAADMNRIDKSAPLTDANYAGSAVESPKVGGV